jgi:hypothetical protein
MAAEALSFYADSSKVDRCECVIKTCAGPPTLLEESAALNKAMDKTSSRVLRFREETVPCGLTYAETDAQRHLLVRGASCDHRENPALSHE